MSLTYDFHTPIIVLTGINPEIKQLAREDKRDPSKDKAAPDIKQIVQRLDMFDRRLDNIDSIVSVVAERVMKQPISFNVTCPNCGQKLEISLIGVEKPAR
jgi:hypothetical protein